MLVDLNMNIKVTKILSVGPNCWTRSVVAKRILLHIHGSWPRRVRFVHSWADSLRKRSEVWYSSDVSFAIEYREHLRLLLSCVRSLSKDKRSLIISMYTHAISDIQQTSLSRENIEHIWDGVFHVWDLCRQTSNFWFVRYAYMRSLKFSMYIQPIAFGFSLNLIVQFIESNWSRFNETWQQRLRELRNR